MSDEPVTAELNMIFKTEQNNPHIYDIVDHWSILFAMYKKRLRVYKQGGFNIDAVQGQEEDENPFQGKCLFL